MIYITFPSKILTEEHKVSHSCHQVNNATVSTKYRPGWKYVFTLCYLIFLKLKRIEPFDNLQPDKRRKLIFMISTSVPIQSFGPKQSITNWLQSDASVRASLVSPVRVKRNSNNKGARIGAGGKYREKQLWWGHVKHSATCEEAGKDTVWSI